MVLCGVYMCINTEGKAGVQNAEVMEMPGDVVTALPPCALATPDFSESARSFGRHEAASQARGASLKHTIE